MRLLAAEPRSAGELLFSSQSLCETILLTQYSMVWDWLVLRSGQCFFIGLTYLLPIVFSVFPFLFFLSTCWYGGAEVFGLIGCKSLSHSFALPTSFKIYNNNDNINNNKNNKNQKFSE